MFRAAGAKKKKRRWGNHAHVSGGTAGQYKHSLPALAGWLHVQQKSRQSSETPYRSGCRTTVFPHSRISARGTKSAYDFQRCSSSDRKWDHESAAGVEVEADWSKDVLASLVPRWAWKRPSMVAEAHRVADVAVDVSTRQATKRICGPSEAGEEGRPLPA